jgi:8-oxo-dGTP diphosphatase
MSIVSGERPGIGVAMIVLGWDRHNQKNLLIGKRKGGRGNGTWALPGVKLDFGESVVHCAARELREETGLDFGDITGDPEKWFKQGPYVENNFPEDNTHWITLVTKVNVVLDVKENPTDSMLMEPDKCFEWRWVLPYQIPDPIFPPLRNLLNQHGLYW